MTLDVKNFYLNTPVTRYKYVRIKIDDIPEEIIVEYNLRDKVAMDGHVYVEIRKGMYGLPQAGLIAQELLEKRLNEEGYFQSKLVPGFWTHQWRPGDTLIWDNRCLVHRQDMGGAGEGWLIHRVQIRGEVPR